MKIRDVQFDCTMIVAVVVFAAWTALCVYGYTTI